MKTLFIFCLFLGSLLQAADSQKPNILFLLADDHQAALMGAYGNKVIQTPNLDKLAFQGTIFTQTHVENPCCIPSRTSLMTGASGFSHKAIIPKFLGAGIPRHLALMPQTLADAGYTTFVTGKWNSPGHPRKYGFKVIDRIYMGGMTKHINMTVKDKNGKKHTGFSSTLFADAAVEFLSEKQERPFFAMVSFTAPHDPRTPPEKYKKMYPTEAMKLPNNFQPIYPFDNGMMNIRDEKLLPKPRTQAAVKREIGYYYGMISQMDTQIGRILAALEKSGQMDNTIVVFAGDHGLAVGQHGLLGKQSMHHHSAATPLIFKGPGIPAGQKRDALNYLHDLFPTFCDISSIAIPEKVQSKSLMNLIKDEKAVNYQTVFCFHAYAQRMVRDSRYKLVRYYAKGRKANDDIRRIQLFDTQNDPDEMKDLSGDPAMAPVIERLGRQLEGWQNKLDDPNKPVAKVVK